LNPGKWSCSLKAVDVRSHAQRTATFTTDWGEAVTLVFSRDPDQLRFRKIPVKAPLATQDAAHSKESK
jgi:hypothetical protein